MYPHRSHRLPTSNVQTTNKRIGVHLFSCLLCFLILDRSIIQKSIHHFPPRLSNHLQEQSKHTSNNRQAQPTNLHDIRTASPQRRGPHLGLGGRRTSRDQTRAARRRQRSAGIPSARVTRDPGASGSVEVHMCRRRISRFELSLAGRRSLVGAWGRRGGGRRAAG